jgi:hypothetical protein
MKMKNDRKVNSKRKYKHSTSHRFGTDLPNFSYDFSEYFINAIIERSLDSDDLYLSVLLLGHKAIKSGVDQSNSSAYPILSLSTDMNSLESWNKASQLWNSERKINATHSGFACRLQNEVSSSPYYSQATWTPSNTSPYAHFNGNLEILKCRLKGVVQAYRSLSLSENNFLFVDIIHRQSLHENSSMLISFSVPWKYRFTGFGITTTHESSSFDPWQTVSDHTERLHRSKVKLKDTSEGNHPSHSHIDHIAVKIHHLCVPNVYITFNNKSDHFHSGEDNDFNIHNSYGHHKHISIHDVINFIEYHIAVGFNHIFLALQADWRSTVMRKTLLVLEDYIEMGKVSVVSTSCK